MNQSIKSEQFFGLIFAGALCLLPLVGVLAPRALSFLPSVIGLFSFLGYRHVFGAWPALSRPIVAVFAGVVAIVAASSLWAIGPDFVLDRAARMAGVFLGAALLLHVALNMRGALLERFVRAFPVAVLVAAVFLLIDLYADGIIYRILHNHFDQRLNASSFNRGVIMTLLAFFPALFFAWHLHAGRVRVFLSAMLMLAIAAILYKTQSQTAQLSFVIGMIFLLFFPAARSKAWVVLMVTLWAMMLASPWIAQGLFAHLPPLIEDVTWFQKSWAPHRMEIWDFVARRALESPIYGHGVEATRFIQDFDTQRIYHPSAQILHPHNFALQIWIELGALGVVFAGALFAALMNWMAKQDPCAARLCVASFMVCVSVVSTGYGMWQGWWLGAMIFVAALCVLASKAKA